jgi:hypothetical protein
VQVAAYRPADRLAKGKPPMKHGMELGKWMTSQIVIKGVFRGISKVSLGPVMPYHYAVMAFSGVVAHSHRAGQAAYSSLTTNIVTQAIRT